MKLIVLAALVLLGCPPSPGPAPMPPDADSAPSPSDACTQACASAKAAGCPEGQFADCSNTCSKELADPGLPHPDTACLVKATTKEQVRQCGWSCK